MFLTLFAKMRGFLEDYRKVVVFLKQVRNALWCPRTSWQNFAVSSEIIARSSDILEQSCKFFILLEILVSIVGLLEGILVR